MELVSNEHLDTLLAGAGTDSASLAAGPLDGLVVDLFQADITPTRTTSDSTYLAGIADYDGYGSATVTWGAPSRADDGTIEVLGTMPEFRPISSDTPNTCFGFFSTLGDGSIGFAGRFDNPPIPMQDALDQITLTLRYRPSQGGLADVIS